eukprot:7441879-Pyramimonas_sp.AAC.1
MRSAILATILDSPASTALENGDWAQIDAIPRGPRIRGGGRRRRPLDVLPTLDPKSLSVRN